MEFITIELRQNIQSCNISIFLEKATEAHHVKITLDPDVITLQIAGNIYPIILSSFRIIPASLSSFTVLGNWIMFRVQSAPLNSSFGTFSTEVVNNSINNEQRNFSKDIKLPPKNSNLNLTCTCCGNVISRDNVAFKKILPLPSDECEPCEWFCCSHNGVDYKNLLCPREQDFFYGSHFCVLNRNIFTAQVKYTQADVMCTRCLSILGLTNDEHSLKIWNHSLQYQLIPATNSDLELSSPLEDFKLALRNCIHSDGTKEILFIAREQNRQSRLLLKPMDTNLCILVESGGHSKMIKLEEKKVLKVLYNCRESNPKYSEEESDLKICRISLKSIIAGVEHLVFSSKRIPPIYRFTDDYCIGYII